jgi:hypothetical protein
VHIPYFSFTLNFSDVAHSSLSYSVAGVGFPAWIKASLQLGMDLLPELYHAEKVTLSVEVVPLAG